MAIASISSQEFANGTAATPPETRIPVQTLGQDDFMKLLVTQLTSQDPLNPTKDTEFIAQMASFSALEQSKAMQANMAQMQANTLIGRPVEVRTKEGEFVTGTVTGVQVKGGVPSVIVNDTPYSLTDVVRVAEPPLDKTNEKLLENSAGLLSNSAGMLSNSSELIAQSRGLQLELARLQANSLLGRTVEIRGQDDARIVGVVSGVQARAGTPQVVVDGHHYDLGQVMTVSNP